MPLYRLFDNNWQPAPGLFLSTICIVDHGVVWYPRYPALGLCWDMDPLRDDITNQSQNISTRNIAGPLSVT